MEQGGRWRPPYLFIMKAIIMAGGKGTRLGEMTQHIPKPLLSISGKSLLDRLFDSLPQDIDEVIITIGHLGEQIIQYTGNYFHGHKVSHVWCAEKMMGTAGTVWAARSLLAKGERFLVVSGDDIYDRNDLEECLKYPLALAFYQEFPPNAKYFSMEVDKEGNITRFARPDTLDKKINVATGVYVLDDRIFGYEPVPLKDNEYALPQTILKMAQDIPVRGVQMNFWLPINTLEDIQKAENVLNSK